MPQFSSQIISNDLLKGAYHILRCAVPAEFSALAQPGQFVHVRIPGLEAHLLRRPFSISDCHDGVLTLVYKVVGQGTEALATLTAGAALNILGPLGHGFTMPATNCTEQTVLLGGGYGCAAMFFYAHALCDAHSPQPLVMLGARSADDILLADEFAALGCDVRISTDDGSRGVQGRITTLLEQLRAQDGANTISRRLAACGPMPMLRALSQECETSAARWSDAEVSLDEIMCCGVGACFGCVVKCKNAQKPEGWEYKRSCMDGPVFKASEVYWG
jgi:dihydroorotate dehydrogenase electron transfer subunit